MMKGENFQLVCGIAGFAGTDLPGGAEQIVVSMLPALARRGPDGGGVVMWSSCVLGHRRLAIYDLSDAGRQPMLANQDRLGIVFNGSIYNFRELQTELKQKGYPFHSNCDTEVLLHGYREWGLDGMLGRLRGMFAFGLWDEELRKLWLVRDRLGVKPLLYCSRGNQIAFASTVDALRVGGFGGAIDPAAMLQFFEYGWVCEDRSIFQGIGKVPPGAYIEWQGGRSTIRHYWKAPIDAPETGIGFEDALSETERLLIESVKYRLDADVPLAALLSGGVDSSLICWAIAQQNPGLRAFTVATPGNASDESSQAAETARILGIPLQVLEFRDTDESLFHEALKAYSEPFGCSSALGMIAISKMVNGHATALLTGDGGDDVYLGYRQHKAILGAQHLANCIPAFAAELWQRIQPLNTPNGIVRRARNLLDFATGGVGAVHRVWDGLPYYRNLGIMGPRIERLELDHRRIPASHASARRLLKDHLLHEQDHRFVSEFLLKVDGAAMYHSIEARSPFLDHMIWEFAARLPIAVRMRRGEQKAILREIVRRRIHPSVADRRKRGFSIPVEDWITTAWRGLLDSAVASSHLEKDGWLAPGGLRKAFDRAGRGRAPFQLYYLAVAEYWLRSLSTRYNFDRNAGQPIWRRSLFR